MLFVQYEPTLGVRQYAISHRKRDKLHDLPFLEYKAKLKSSSGLLCSCQFLNTFAIGQMESY